MAKAKRVENRSRQANYQRRRKAAGICPRCGNEPLDINQRTGKHYSSGPRCRRAWNDLQAAKMRRRRAAGRAV